jgi:hypothetical protein
MPAVPLFIAALLTVVHMDRLSVYTYRNFALVIRLTIAIRIGNAKVRSSAVCIEGKSKAKTLGIGVY